MNTASIIAGEKIALKTIFHLIIMGSVKLIAGLLTGLTVMIADAMATFADTLGVFASYFGLKLSRKSADKNFAYGYYKIETLSALVVSIGIIILGFLVFMEAIKTLQTPSEGKYRILALLTTIIAINHSHRLYTTLSEAAKKSNSLSLMTSAKDKKMDMYAGIAVLISIFANYLEISYVEGIVSLTLAAIILKTGILSAKESLFFLLDYWDNPVLKRKIHKVLLKEQDFISKVKRLRLRRAGTFIFGEAFVEINPYCDLSDLREELKILQNKIHNLNPYIKDFVIYTNITKANKVKIALPLKKGRDLKGELAENLSLTNGYLFVEIKNGKIKNNYFKKLNKNKKNPVDLGEFLKEEKSDIVIDNKLNSLTYFNLRRTHHILIYPNFSDIKKAAQTIELLLIDT